MRDRRKPDQQPAKPGGYRWDDPQVFLSVQQCGVWVKGHGIDADEDRGGEDWILRSMHEGRWSLTLSRLVQLQAVFLPGTTATSPGQYQIEEGAFITFLEAIGFPYIPKRTTR